MSTGSFSVSGIKAIKTKVLTREEYENKVQQLIKSLPSRKNSERYTKKAKEIIQELREFVSEFSNVSDQRLNSESEFAFGGINQTLNEMDHYFTDPSDKGSFVGGMGVIGTLIFCDDYAFRSRLEMKEEEPEEARVSVQDRIKKIESSKPGGGGASSGGGAGAEGGGAE